MPEDRQFFGDGQDDYLRGAREGLEAARRFQAAAAVKAGAEGGRAVSGAAAGVAAGGPWGAAISAAWALRHTLFKIIVSLCLFLLFITVAVVSLPSVVTNNLFHLDPGSVDPSGPTELSESFDDLAGVVSACIQDGHDAALEEVERIISAGGYDHDKSIAALNDQGLVSPDYDTCYVLAAYSASMEQRGASRSDLKAKLQASRGRMYQVTYEEKETTVTVTGENGQSESKTVRYAACTVHPFDQSVILTAFGVDTSAQYGQFGVTYGDAISHMSQALKMTLYGAMGGGTVTGGGMTPTITDDDLNDYVDSLSCSGSRKELIRAALSLVGKVPYFWGGKSAPGWNDAWNTPRLVTAAGSKSTGTIRPYGLDCTGFTDWVYKTALGVSLYEGSWRQWDNTYAITEAQLQPGDLGFMAVPGTVPVNHTLLYAGKDAQGKKLWIHCSSSKGVVMNSPTYVTQFRRPNGVNLEADAPHTTS